MENPPRPSLVVGDIEYDRNLTKQTLFRAAQQLQECTQHNGDVAYALWRKLKQTVIFGASQQQMLKKAQEKASKARTFQHEARTSKAESKTSTDAWKVERSSYGTQIATLKEAKKSSDEALKDAKENIKELKAKLAFFKSKQNAENIELDKLKKRNNELELQVKSSQLDAQLEEALKVIHHGDATTAKKKPPHCDRNSTQNKSMPK